MTVRLVLIASVSAALLAASAAVPSVQAAPKSQAVATVDKAYRSLVSGKLVDAIAQYSEAIESRELPPETLANALLNRALAYQNRNQHADAVDDYSAAMRVDAMSAKLRAVALYNRALSHQKLDKPAQAIEDFTNALFLDVKFAQAYYGRGNVLRESGQYLFALSDYEKAVKYHHPEPHLPLFGVALTYEDLRRPEQAQKSLVQALVLKPDFAAARMKLTQLLTGAEVPSKDTASMGVTPAAQKMAANRDQIVTGSLDKRTADLVMRKEELPVPVSPPSALMAKTNLVSDKPAAPARPKLAELKVEKPSEAPQPKLQQQASAGPVIEPANAPAPKTELNAKKLEGWTVQLSSQKNEGAAWKVWKKLVEADLGDRGIFYRLRVHKINSKKSAARLCSRLKRRGTSCFVSRARS
jgi:tetratricopeptide (TPR) repeat protein